MKSHLGATNVPLVEFKWQFGRQLHLLHANDQGSFRITKICALCFDKDDDAGK
jgi:hypothetical protein